MTEINEQLKRIREAEEEVTRKIKMENDRAQARIDEARKRAQEIVRNAEKELESIRMELEKNYNEQLENEISKLKSEWKEKMDKLSGLNIDPNYIDEIARSLLEEK